MSGQSALDSGNAIQSTPSHFCSNLTGLCVLFDPISILGYLIARMVRPIPYMNLGSTWMLSRNYEGTGAWKKWRKTLSDISLDFAAAGQDAISVVFYLYTYSQKRHVATIFADWRISST